MEKVKLSVIIPCYNAAETLGGQLKALANQSWSEKWEVIISDNGSTDDTMAIAGKYKQMLPSLCIVDSSDRRGAAHARNVGVRFAHGEALAFCDADDEVAPDWVAEMGKALTVHDFVACRIDIEKLNAPWVRKYFRHPQQNGIQSYDYPSFLPHAGGGTIGVIKSLHDSIGGFDESMSLLEDTDYCWRILLSGRKLTFVPNAVIHVRLKNNIRDIYRQASKWGEYNVLIYKRYLPLGMPKLSWKECISTSNNFLKSFIKNLPMIPDKGDIASWAWHFGWRIGRLKGSIKHKIVAF